LAYQIEFRLRGRHTTLRFLLKRMQHVNRSGEPHGVHGTKRIAVEVVHDFQHPRIAKALKRLRIRRLPANPRVPERATDPSPDIQGKPLTSSLLLSTQRTGLDWSPPLILAMRPYMPELV
jgi:hypothetical protein